MRICTACGKTTADDKVYCPVCGTKLPEPTQPDCTNTIDEINLVNTRLRSVPAKPNNTAKYAIIIGAAAVVMILLIVVIIAIAMSNGSKTNNRYNTNKTPVTTSNSSYGIYDNFDDEESLKSDTVIIADSQDILTTANTAEKVDIREDSYYTFYQGGAIGIITDDNYIYLQFPFFEAMYYARATYSISGDTITLGSVDLYKYIAAEIPKTKGIDANFYDVHIMDAGARLRYKGDSLTIIDFESYWKLYESGFTYPSQYKNGTELYISRNDHGDDYKITNTPTTIPTQPTTHVTTRQQQSGTDILSALGGGAEKSYYTQRGSYMGDSITINADYVTLYFEYYGETIKGTATYTLSGNTLTLGTVTDTSGNNSDIMEAGAQIVYNDYIITVHGFEDRWIWTYDGENAVVPDAYKDGTTLHVFS